MKTATRKYSADCEAVLEFLHAWHEDGRLPFEMSYLHIDYDRDYPKRATNRKKYICLDNGSSGQFILDAETGDVWTIAGYGRPNKRYHPTQIEKMTADFRQSERVEVRPSWHDCFRPVRSLFREASGAHWRDCSRLLGLAADALEDAGHHEHAAHLRAAIPGLESSYGTARSDRITDLWRALVQMGRTRPAAKP